MSEQDVDHIKRLIESKNITLEETQSYLAKVEEQAAIYGINTPPKMQLEMEQLQKKIDEIQNELSDLQNKKQDLIKSTVDRNLVPQVGSYSRKREHQISTKGIIYWVLIPIFAMGFVLADIIVAYPNMQTPVVYEQIIDSNYHHLGDNTYSEEYMQSISGDKIRNLSPEGLSYSTTFDLIAIREAAGVNKNALINNIEITLYVNQLKPRVTAPVIIGLNGEYVAHLNNYVKSEEWRRELITIPVNVPVLNGQNEIEIVTGKDTEQYTTGFDEYEDFEFDTLAIKVDFDEKHLMNWPFGGIILGEILALGFMGFMLSKSLE